MSKQLYRSIQLFFLIVLTFFLVTSCYSQGAKNVNLPKAQLAASECRVIKHSLGETCVPINPQRLIVIDEMTLEAVVALGLQPVAATEPNLAGSRVGQLVGKASGIASLGKDSQLNIERMVLLQPDLILGFDNSINSENYKLFSQIAPTVSLGEYVQTDWKDSLRRTGEILGRRKEAEQALNQYHQRVEELRKAIGNKLGNTEVSLSRFYAGRQTTQFRTIHSFPVSVMQEVGLSVPMVQRQLTSPEQTYVRLSLERTELLDADVLFVAIDPGAEKPFQKYQKSPLWQLLNPVKNNQVYTVDSSYWLFGNILSANAILDDISKYLLSS